MKLNNRGFNLFSQFCGLVVLMVTLFGVNVAPAYALETIVVENGNDSGVGSLRQAIADAPTGATIVFDPLVTTVTLTSGQLTINKNLDIVGHASGVTIQRDTSQSNFRIFNITSGNTVSLVNLTITGGHLPFPNDGGSGGGIFSNGTVTITNSTVSDNSATFGGGIRSFGIVTITNSTVSNNSAESIGGGIYSNATMSITNSTISDNSAVNQGGGIYSVGGIVTITNSTISDNSADFSGGIYSNATTNITNSTISDNSAVNQGGGIFGDGGTITISHSIVAGNTGGGSVNCAGTITIGGSNNIIGQNADAGGCPTTGNTILAGDISTLLAPLDNNGGPTQTHALVTGSPAIDSTTAGSEATDQRGVPAVGNRDIGAFEFGASPTYPTVQFASAGATYDEDAGTVDITLSVTGAVNFAGISQVFVADTLTGTAIPGVDYTAFPLTTITIDCSSGCPEDVTVPLSLLTDSVLEPDETVILQIIATNGFATIGAQDTFTATIQDATTSTATINATVNTATLAPLANGELTVDLGALNNTGSPITVNYDINGTANAGTDYVALTGSVTIPDVAQTAIVEVEPLFDFVGTRTVVLTLTSTSDARVSVNTAPATVTIQGSLTPLPPVDDDEEDTASDDTPAPSLPQLILTGLGVAGVQGEGVPNAGQNAQWQFGISNNTGSPIDNVTARVTFPDDDMEGVSADASNGATGTFSQGSLLVDYNLGTIQAGETVTLNIVTRLPNRAGIFTGTLTVNVSPDSATLSLLTVSQLPATGEPPAWAIRLRQWLGME